jgi:hypothetical protein
MHKKMGGRMLAVAALAAACASSMRRWCRSRRAKR